ncbi:hypothetical protein, partial [Micromonospora sp. KC721]|uniref:hypothetical protein n=1 Tax=Micromonospora sp. KC721 TaxID=2530380 RepID=UPI00352CE18B
STAEAARRVAPSTAERQSGLPRTAPHRVVVRRLVRRRAGRVVVRRVRGREAGRREACHGVHRPVPPVPGRVVVRRPVPPVPGRVVVRRPVRPVRCRMVVHPEVCRAVAPGPPVRWAVRHVGVPPGRVGRQCPVVASPAAGSTAAGPNRHAVGRTPGIRVPARAATADRTTDAPALTNSPPAGSTGASGTEPTTGDGVTVAGQLAR